MACHMGESTRWKPRACLETIVEVELECNIINIIIQPITVGRGAFICFQGLLSLLVDLRKQIHPKISEMIGCFRKKMETKRWETVAFWSPGLGDSCVQGSLQFGLSLGVHFASKEPRKIAHAEFILGNSLGKLTGKQVLTMFQNVRCNSSEKP